MFLADVAKFGLVVTNDIFEVVVENCFEPTKKLGFRLAVKLLNVLYNVQPGHLDDVGLVDSTPNFTLKELPNKYSGPRTVLLQKLTDVVAPKRSFGEIVGVGQRTCRPGRTKRRS